MSEIEYPFSSCIYSKNRYVEQHRRCFFNAKNIRSTYNQVIDYVIWEHCGRDRDAFWTATNYSTSTGDRTKFCLQDIIDICNYNGVQFKQLETSVILEETSFDLNMEVRATITERDGYMYITWEYRPYTHYHFKFYINEACIEEHLITILDIEQLKHVFDFYKI